MADTASTATDRTAPDVIRQAYATGGLPPLVALLLPLLVAVFGLAAVALAPKQAGSASPSVDPTITGAIAVAPLFQGQRDVAH